MMKKHTPLLLNAIVTFTLFFFLIANNHAHELSNSLKHTQQPSSIIQRSNNLNDLQDIIKKNQHENILVVLDIDDTLITANEFFGSDKWYDWQRGKALDPQGNQLSITKHQKAPCLFDIMALTFELGTTRPTQYNALKVTQAIKKDKIIISARGNVYRAATLKQLNKNGFNFKPNQLTQNQQPISFRIQYKNRNVEIEYANGVVLASGVDKGQTLVELLRRLHKSYTLVILADDKLHNLKNMQKAMKKANIHFYGLHYTRISKRVQKQEIQSAEKALNMLQKFIKTQFPKRFKQLTNQQCAY